MREKIKNAYRKISEKITKKGKIFLFINAGLFLITVLFDIIFVQSSAAIRTSLLIVAAVIALFAVLYLAVKRNETLKKRIWCSVIAAVVVIVSCWSVYYFRDYELDIKNLYSRGEKLETVEDLENAYENKYQNLFMKLEKDNFSKTPLSYVIDWRIEKDDGTMESVKTETLHRYYLLRYGDVYFLSRVQPDYLDEYFGNGEDEYRRVKLQEFGKIDIENYERLNEEAYEYIYAYPELGDEAKEDDDYEMTPGGKYEWIYEIYGDLPEVDLHDTFTIIIEEDSISPQQALYPTATVVVLAAIAGIVQIWLVEKKTVTEHINPFLRDKNKTKKNEASRRPKKNK